MIDALIESEAYQSDVDLMQDLFVLFVAGLDSIRNETVSSIYHLVANKNSLKKFKDEMDVHIFNKTNKKEDSASRNISTDSNSSNDEDYNRAKTIK